MMEIEDDPYGLIRLPILLMICYVSMCYFIRLVKSPRLKQWISTVYGVCFLYLLCGNGVAHAIICFLGNSLIILYGNKRHVHVMCFTFSMMHCTILNFDQYLGLPGITNSARTAFMIMFLKLVNLSMDVQNSFTKKVADGVLHKRNEVYRTLTGVKLFHFSMTFVGVYVMIRYRTYHDWIHTACPSHELCLREALVKLRNIVLICCFILPSEYFFTAEFTMSDDFAKQSLWYRLTYALLAGTTVRWFLYFLMTSLDFHRALAGLGLYPVATKPKPGEGPTQNFKLLQQILYASFFVSGWWHESSLALLVAFLCTALYLETEDIWLKLYRHNATGFTAKLLDFLFFTTRFFWHSIAFCVMGLFIRNGKLGYRFMETFNFIPLLFPFMMYALGTALTHAKKRPNTNKGG